MAKQERIRLSERTMAGLEKARKEGRVGGRPKVITDRQGEGASCSRQVAADDSPGDGIKHHHRRQDLQGRCMTVVESLHRGVEA